MECRKIGRMGCSDERRFHRTLCVLLPVLAIVGLLLTVPTPPDAGETPPGMGPGDRSGIGAPAHTGMSRVRDVTEWYEAVGTIRPRTESRISTRLTARIVDVRVRPGDPVAKDDLLVVLDDRELMSRLEQARQGRGAAAAAEEKARQALVAAEAARTQTQAEFQRVRAYFESEAATRKDLEQAESAFRQAEAGVQQARQALAGAGAGIRQAEAVVGEAEIALGYARILAPERGEVLERFVEPGDMAMPGSPLLTLRTAGALRIEAFVREGLIRHVPMGSRMPVNIASLETTVEARVEEVVPYADPRTRTFLVKAALPEVDGLYPGMFARLMIPVGKLPVVLVPAAAVRRVGQLEMVSVLEADQWKSVYVTSGRAVDDQIEVLSGLNGGETIGWDD